MRTRTPLLLALMGAALAACAGGRDNGPLADDLKRDLEAAGSKIELAGQSAQRPLAFVSELEQGKAAEPVQRARTPRPVAAKTAGVEPETQSSPSPESQNQVQVAQASEAPQAPAPSPDAPTVPMVAPRPASLPVNVPSDGMRGQGSGGIGAGDGSGGIGIGDVIGVVIRGGGVGPDHCPPRRRPRNRPIILP